MMGEKKIQWPTLEPEVMVRVYDPYNPAGAPAPS